MKIEGEHFSIRGGKLVANQLTKRNERLPKTRLGRWIAERWPSEVFDGGGRCLWLRRWTLCERWGWSVFLHHWLNDDWSVHHHDHSRDMISIGLRGSYTEHLFDGTTRTFRAPWVRRFPAEHRHYITLETPTAWTLVIAMPIRRGSAFWVDGQPITAGSTYMNSPFADQQKRC